MCIRDRFNADVHSTDLLHHISSSVHNGVVFMGSMQDAKRRAEQLTNCSPATLDEVLTALGRTVLGDMMVGAYKLQAVEHAIPKCIATVKQHKMGPSAAVSYTHLTLPTIYSV
eukprot:TRINITY_DN10907_c0_g1_i1.p1 TRINITY_DN10907_c0_g1~~TRINITY_DN10907_c0_g1_i1.p1  ORF type:complete len:113 (-),score=48.44 TRINITY_DN10907_c0_g1_i1:121-459(-)